jgi:eukaryotic-like serine/threonine-protein kinase
MADERTGSLPPSARRSFPPGFEFAGRFRLGALLGRGSMGTVYEAERLADGALVALKLSSLTGGDGRARRRFTREAEAALKIESPHVARALASGEDPASGRAWIAFELARGPTLDVYVREHPGLPLEDAARLLAGLGDALAAAHRAGVVHRDLKPENLRVEAHDGRPHLLVLDFGIAKEFKGLDVSATAPGLGTPLWVAPEQSREGYVAAPSADVWAFGLVAFFVLTGQLYWRHAADASSLADLALELLKSELEPASVRARALGVSREPPPGFDAWFARAVNRDPAARFADGAEASHALGSLFDVRAERGGPVVERPVWLLLLLIAGCAAMGYAISRIIRGG